jgi:antitoxin component YwqK of YwqJK toxin-antitoxin module
MLAGLFNAAAAPANDRSDVQVVRERYADGAIASVRNTVQNAQGDYVNHGEWSAFYRDGKKIGGGEYVMGKREGKWSRWFADYDEDSLFSQPLYREYHGPFKSEADFKHGEIDGIWTIDDRNGQRINEWHFVNGAPHGEWTWYYPSGQKRRQATYVNGTLHGKVHEWAASGKLTSAVEFIGGRKLEHVVEYHHANVKEWEGSYLRAKEVTRTAYEWWLGEAETTVVSVTGEDQRVGKWTWCYAHGQKRIAGSYSGGKPDRQWIWWHPNGQRSISGEYVLGEKSGEWKYWSPTGHLERAEYFPSLQRPDDELPTARQAPQDSTGQGQDNGQPSEDEPELDGRDEVPSPPPIVSEVTRKEPPVKESGNQNDTKLASSTSAAVPPPVAPPSSGDDEINTSAGAPSL